MRFYGISVPISIALATIYFWWITRDRKGEGQSGKLKEFKDIDVVVHKKAASCTLQAKKGDLVHLHYTAYSKKTGKQVSTSREKEQPYAFKLGTCNDKTLPECMKGFTKGLAGMCVGEKRKITIPPHLAYGKQGREPDVPPDDSILFHVDMVDIDSF
mmetsp:Transcript_62548/g.116297  ORF Transcript_62548/g.116297 Transcript_62548/m.116297 type:complete len:157 (-) Transcript_62548:107-577(-)